MNSRTRNINKLKIGDNVQDISEVPFQNIEMGVPSIPDHIPTSWTPHPEDIQLYTTQEIKTLSEDSSIDLTKSKIIWSQKEVLNAPQNFSFPLLSPF